MTDETKELEDQINQMSEEQNPEIAQFEAEVAAEEKKRAIYQLLTLQNDISVKRFGVPLQKRGKVMLYSTYRDLPIEALNKIISGTEKQLQELLYPTVPRKESMCNRFGCWFSSLFGKSGKKQKRNGKKQKRNGKKSKRGLRKVVSKKRVVTKSRSKNCSVTKK